jgi:predicted O-methyltransferase YrrM
VSGNHPFPEKEYRFVDTKVKLKIAMFSYGGNSGFPHVISGLIPWMVQLTRALDNHPMVGPDGWALQIYSDTPITMTRNQAVCDARKGGFDAIVMLDSDNWPDFFKDEPGQVTNSVVAFLEFAVPRLHKGLPTVIAAPYCGPPPDPHNMRGENIYAFRWERYQHDDPNAPFALEQYSVAEAAKMAGIHPAGAAATGVMLATLNSFDILDPKDGGYFYYEWTDEFQQQKASTEDVTFTRNFSMASQQIHGENCLFVHWDAWAAHIKSKVVGKPRPIAVESITTSFREAVANDHRRGDRMRQADFGIPKPSIKAKFDTRVPSEPKNPREMSDAELVKRVAALAKPPAVSRVNNNGHLHFDETDQELPPKAAGFINGRPVWLREQDAKDYIASLLEGGMVPTMVPAETQIAAQEVATQIEQEKVDPLVRHETICGRSFLNLGWETGQEDMAGLQRATTFMEELMGRPIRCLEVGSWCGASAVAIASSFNLEGSHLWCVDTWMGSPADQTGTWVLYGAQPRRLFDTNTQDLQDEDKVRPIIGESSAVAAKFSQPENLDLIYIDSGHTRSEIERDIDCWWRHLSDDGVMMFHDYEDPGHPAVTQVLNERFGPVLQKFAGSRLAFVVKRDVEAGHVDHAAPTEV